MTLDEMQAMLASGEEHWWHRGRRRIMHAELDRVPPAHDRCLLDAGCGSSRTPNERATSGRASGVGLSPTAVAATWRHGHDDVQLTAVEEIPFPDATFDVVTCLDVIEHTRDDQLTLAELLRVTCPGGLLLMTVSAYQAVSAAHGTANLHYRRYDRSSLSAAARAPGWDVVSDSYFNGLLLAPAAAVCFASRWRHQTHSDLEVTPPILNGVLELPLRLESRILTAGSRLHAGLSLLTVLRRPSVTRP